MLKWQWITIGRLTFKTGSRLRVQCSGLLYWKLARFPLYLDNCARLCYTASRPLSGFKQPNVWVKLGLSTYLKGELTQTFKFCHLLTLISHIFPPRNTSRVGILAIFSTFNKKQLVIVAVKLGWKARLYGLEYSTRITWRTVMVFFDNGWSP